MPVTYTISVTVKHHSEGVTMRDEDGLLLPTNNSMMEYAQYDSINIAISFTYLFVIMLPSILLGSFISTAIALYKPYPTPHNVLIVHTLLSEMIYAITRGISFVFTIIEIFSNDRPSFSCRFTDAFLRLLVMLTHTNLAAMIFITLYGVCVGMQNLNLKHGTRLIAVQWTYSLIWITLHHFILGPEIMQERASRCIFHINSIDIGGFILAVFTGMVTVIASALLVIIFSALTHIKLNNLGAVDEQADMLVKSIQRYTLGNGIVFALLAVPTTVFYWIAPLFIDIDDTGAIILPQAVSYAALEFVTQIILQVYLITDAVNILLIFKEVRMASKKLLLRLMKRAYLAWKMKHKCYPKSNKVAPVVPDRSEESVDERSQGSENEILDE